MCGKKFHICRYKTSLNLERWEKVFQTTSQYLHMPFKKLFILYLVIFNAIIFLSFFLWNDFKQQRAFSLLAAVVAVGGNICFRN